jgi:cholesterol oxidase
MQDVWHDLKRVYFDRALGRLDPQALPADVEASPPYVGTSVFDSFAAAAGYPEQVPGNPSTLTFGRTLVPVTVDWNAVRDELAGRRIPAFTAGEVWWGNNSGAKKSLDKPEGYLGRAVATGHVVVQPLHTVTAVSFDEKRRVYVVDVTHTDEAYQTLATETFTSHRLFMAAGSLGTTKLLVRARDTGALPKLNDFVGTRWNTNGDMAAFRFASTSAIPQGGPATVKITDFGAPGNPALIELGSQRVPSFFASNPTLQPFVGALFTIGFGVPTGAGAFRYDSTSDTVVLDWPSDGAANVFSRVTQILSSPSFPGVPFLLPMAQAQQTTVHPLGGVPLGLATDLHCRLRGYHGLYAVDGSVLPGPAAATNPSLLITALAERCMDFVTRHLSDADDDVTPGDSGDVDD